MQVVSLFIDVSVLCKLFLAEVRTLFFTLLHINVLHKSKINQTNQKHVPLV